MCAGTDELRLRLGALAPRGSPLGDRRCLGGPLWIRALLAGVPPRRSARRSGSFFDESVDLAGADALCPCRFLEARDGRASCQPQAFTRLNGRATSSAAAVKGSCLSEEESDAAAE